jgi:hypothetical protein
MCRRVSSTTSALTTGREFRSRNSAQMARRRHTWMTIERGDFLTPRLRRTHFRARHALAEERSPRQTSPDPVPRPHRARGRWMAERTHRPGSSGRARSGRVGVSPTNVERTHPSLVHLVLVEQSERPWKAVPPQCSSRSCRRGASGTEGRGGIMGGAGRHPHFLGRVRDGGEAGLDSDVRQPWDPDCSRPGELLESRASAASAARWASNTVQPPLPRTDRAARLAGEWCRGDGHSIGRGVCC